MIAVSEPPLEFVPRGRQAAEEHPGPSEPTLPKFLPAEHLLLQRLQNVNISAASKEPQEFWSIREIYDDYEASYARAQRRQQLIEQTKKCGPKAAAATQLTSLPQQLLQPIQMHREDPMCDYFVNNEEELYVNKNTVIWTQGLNDDDDGVHRRMCFTCDTPVKFACFLNRRFVRGRLAQLRAAVQPDEDHLTAICVVDQDALRVYCDDGEDFLANLDFPVSHLWQTVHGLLLEKDSGNALVSHTVSIPMPRLFSMSHPLHEACPVVLKTSRKATGYMTEPEYSVVFTAEDSDLVLLYDAKFFKHFVARLRKVTPEEVNNVSQQQELLSQTLQGHRDGAATSGINSFSSTKLTGATTKLSATSLLGRNNNGATSVNNFSRFGLSQSQSFSGVLGQSNRALLGTPLSQLQNSISQQSMSIKDMRKITHVKPAKPIEPEMCLEHIWTENTYGTQREFCEMATRAFIHTDLVGQTYLCYLLARSCRLQLVLLNGYDTDEPLQLSTLAATLNAKDAVGLPRLHMIAVLDPGGSLILYTGTVLISKVHITPLLTRTTPAVHVQLATPPPPPPPAVPVPVPTTTATPTATGTAGSHLKSTTTTSSSFGEVRRSSLLPTIIDADFNAFDEELHMLSPIAPQPISYTQRQAHNVCKALRDPAGNRLTLVYATGRMLRISLPLLNDTRLITRCVAVLRQVLNPGQFLHFIIRWYSARNPPGSRDYSIEQEWQLFRSTLLSLMGCMAGTATAATAATTTTAAAATPSSSAEMSNELGGDASVTASATASASASAAYVVDGCSTPPLQPQQQHELGFQDDEPLKRRKYNDCESYTDEDWEFLLLQTTLTSCLHDSPHMYSVDVTAPLFCSLPAIFYGLHLLYEDLKLDTIFQSGLNYLATFLHQLAIDMQLDSYILHYHLDFPELTQKTTKLTMLSEEHGAQMLYQELLRMPAPSIYAQLEHVLRGREEVAPYSYVECINERSRNVVQLISLVMHGHHKLKHWWHLLEHFGAVQSNYPKRPKRSISADVPRCHQVIELLLCMQMTRRDITRLPAAVHLVLAEALERARLTPPVGSSWAAYELILRPELAAHAQLPFLETTIGQPHCGRVYKEDSLSPRLAPSSGELPMPEPDADHLRHDGMDNMDTKLLRLRFPDDMRVEEVRRLLNSADPVSIEVQQSPGTSDHEFIEEQEKQLFAYCARTMTLPLGRGMFTLRTLLPRPSDNMPMPKLCLAGREPVKGTTIEMQQIEFPANMHQWPSFHNGVATGLKISPQAQDIDSTWIVYNKPKTQANNGLEHAGFLMALGLNGHLRSLSFMSIFKYLVKCDEMTSVGLLLGISAAHRGTMDTKTTKLLSVHLEALLPATAMELDIPQSTQVAALMGIGLLYQGSAKRHIAEVLLQEIGRPPGPEMENSVERESYAMTAGLALGLVTLGQGESPAGLRDLQLPDTLHYYMVGGVKRPIGGSQKEKYRLASFQVREGDNVNIDVTAPGATLALGLMFFDSGNEAIAEWMRPPDSRYLLDMVRPDFLLLRTIARGLILWQQVQPDNDWFQAQFPHSLRPHLRLPSREEQTPEDSDVDYEAITQAYCNILAGAAFCIGLKYAGTENPLAFATLRAVIKEFLGFPGTPMGECAGRTTIESCLMVLLISISLVFAGSGNCEILRIIRYLRSRVGPQYPHITYGSHMAIHMSLGLLFLGAGRYTIAKTPESIAALVCAFFPKFPIHSNDNRYHLQALRHLYVLAVEPRLFLPRDIDTHQLCLCNISVLEVGANVMRRLPIAPCILPELSTLEQVIVDDENYWPVCFERSRNWHQLEKALELCAPIDIKKRTGCLSHLEDPDRLKSMLAQTLTMEQSICWQVDVNDLQQFASERLVKPFLNRFLDTKGTSLSYVELSKRHQLMLLFYNAVVNDRMHLLPVYLTLFDHVTKKMANNNDVWQVKLLDAYLCGSRIVGQPIEEHSLISVDLIQMMQEMFKLQVEDWTSEQCLALREYLSQKRLEPSFVGSISAQDLQRVFCIINYFNLMPNLLSNVDLSAGPVNYLRIMLEFNKLQLSPHTIFGLLKIFQALASICDSEDGDGDGDDVDDADAKKEEDEDEDESV
ncbi:anaphase-promoting complex subunit 1 [Drosophila grimshawi]|uniref:anaphase-promoting complex subunit 1 n=1 Tax=Drosophila grimshawi TaxID=7222 RepID=UPI000C86EADA|nr:anaphase-promoting complex subunit 1 [Drosophila grimshawi]